MNIRTLLFTTSVFGGSMLIAQPTLTATNSVGASGSEFPIARADNFMDVGASGAAQAYGFWPASVGNRDYKYLAPSVTPTTVASATLLTTDGGTDTLFFSFGTDGLERRGEKNSLAGLVTYSDPVLELKLPLDYGDTWTDNFAASFSVQGIANTRIGTIAGEADGYGSLALPEAIVDDVLRVKVRKVINDQNPFAAIYWSFDTYYFFDGMTGHPVMKMSIDTVIIGAGNPAVTRTAEWMFGPGQVGVTELSYDDVQFTAYPNPATAEVNLSFNNSERAARSVEIFDASGQLIQQQAIANTGGGLIASAFDVSGLAQGVYQVRLSFSDGTRSTQRLVVR